MFLSDSDFGSFKIGFRCLTLLLVVVFAFGAIGQAQNVTMTPAGPVNFGQVTVGSNTTQTVVLSMNTALTLASVQTSGDYSVQSNSCGLNTPLAAGTVCSLQVQFTPSVPGRRWFPLLVTDSNSIKYAFGLEGVGLGSVFAFTPGIINTVAGKGNYGYSGDGGPATDAVLYDPEGVAVDSSGNIYVAEAFNGVIRKVDTNGIINTVAGNGITGYSGDGGPATSAEFYDPASVALDSAGNLYIADTNNTVIRKVDANGIITTIAGTGGRTYTGDGGPAVNATLFNPYGIAVGSGGVLYIADTGNAAVRKVDANGIITTVAGTGVLGYSGDGGPATAAQIGSAHGVAVDGAGNLYIADNYNNVIRKVDSSGIITTFAGNGSMGTSGDGGPAINAPLYYPVQVAADSAGNVYIVDSSERVRKVDTAGTIYTVAGFFPASFWYGGDGGPATKAEFQTPFGVAVDNLGNIYIADLGNQRVRKVDVTTSGVWFSPVNVGQTSPAQSVLISDVGNEPLNLSSFSISPNFEFQSVGNDCSAGTPLGIGGDCSLGMVFVPSVAGPLTGTVTVGDDALNNPHVMDVNGAIQVAPTVLFIGAPGIAYYGTVFEVAGLTNASTTAVITATGPCSVNGNLVTVTSGSGICITTAIWAADANYTGATLSQYTTAIKATSSVTITSNTPNPVKIGQGVTVAFAVTGNGVPTGSVTVSANSGESCNGGLTAGLGSCTLTFNALGLRTFTATYLGDGNFDGSTSLGVIQNILAAGVDLIEIGPSVLTPNPFSGGTIVVVDTTMNQGISTAGPSWTRLYLSTNGTTKGTMLGTRSVPSLIGGAISQGSIVGILPLNLNGTYYIIACADDTNAVVESNETNNCSFSAGVAISGADLAETAVFPTTTPGAGTTIVISDTASNKGGGNAGASWTRFYLSTNGTTKTTMLGSRSVPALNAGATSGPVNTNVTLPLNLNGQYFVIACADDTNAVVESNETNNCLASGAIQVAGADLVEASVYPPSSAAAGGTMSVIDTVTNQGGGNASNSWTRFYLSTNGTTKGTVLGTRTVPALIAGAGSGPVTTNLTAPMNTSGVYWVIACADDTNAITETNETNNCTTSNAFQIAAADLIESTVSAPVSGGSGGVITVTDTTSNQGGGNANSSWTRFYLSTNGTTKSTMLGSRSVPALATGVNSGPVNTNLTLPLNLSGTYYIIACADDTNAVVESYENNNCTASGPIAVQ